MKYASLLTVLATGLVTATFAESLTFDFKDPKGVNTVSFKLDAPLESISGSANGFSGTVTTDPATLSEFKGKLVVAVDSLQVPNPIMNGHVHGEQWLDAKKFPEITFEIGKVSNVKREGDAASGEVTGVFTLHGVSKEITAPAKVTYLPGRLKDRVPNAEGDLLVIRSEFTINRGDFDIQKGRNEDKVSNEIKITLAVAGAAPKK